MSDYQRLHDALTEKGFKPQPDDNGFFTFYSAALCIRQLQVKTDENNKPEDKSKTQLKKEVATLKSMLAKFQTQASEPMARPFMKGMVIDLKSNINTPEETIDQMEIVGDNGTTFIGRVLNQKDLVEADILPTDRAKVANEQYIHLIAEQQHVMQIIKLLEENLFHWFKSSPVGDNASTDNPQAQIRLHFSKFSLPTDIKVKALGLLSEAKIDTMSSLSIELGYQPV